MGRVNQITTLVDFWEFQSGWVLGWLALPVVVLLGWSGRAQRHGRRSPYGLVGIAWVIASLMALAGWAGHEPVLGSAGFGELPAQLLVGLALSAVAVELAFRTPNPKVIGCLLGIPGAVLVGTASDFRGPSWTAPLVIVTTLVGGPLAADVDRRAARLGLGPVLWLITVIGVYATVPDTELVRPLVGVAIPLAIAGWPLRAARLGAGGVAAATGLLTWVAGLDGYGRPGRSWAPGALGLLLVEPLGRIALKGRVRPLARRIGVKGFVAAFVGAEIVVVFWATRRRGDGRHRRAGRGAADSRPDRRRRARRVPRALEAAAPRPHVVRTASEPVGVRAAHPSSGVSGRSRRRESGTPSG